jgi:two-component system cell cycle response regulator CtrA
VADYQKRCEMLEAEVTNLRGRIEQLTELLGMTLLVPLEFGLTGKEAALFGILMERPLATKEGIMLYIYGNNANNEVEIKIVDVFICKLRKKLKAFDIDIETVWGRGYCMTPASKAKVRELLATFNPVKEDAA